MLRKYADQHDFEDPKTDEVETFNSFKEALVTPSVLALPMVGRPYIIDVDASAYQKGFTILQGQENSYYWQVGYWSRTLIQVERNYSRRSRSDLQ